MLDFLLVLILFFSGLFEHAGMGAASGGHGGRRDRAGGGRVDLVAGRAGRRAWRGYCADRMYGVGGSNGAGSTARRWGGPRSAHNRERKSVLNWRTRFPPSPAAVRRNLNRGENRS